MKNNFILAKLNYELTRILFKFLSIYKFTLETDECLSFKPLNSPKNS